MEKTKTTTKATTARRALVQPIPPQNTSERSYLAASLFTLLLGTIGVDRFYMGYVGLGILKLITFGGCGIWYIVDVILILTNNLKDAEGYKLSGYQENKKLVIFIVIGYLVLELIGSIFAFYTISEQIKNDPEFKKMWTELQSTSEKPSLDESYSNVEIGMTNEKADEILGRQADRCEEESNKDEDIAVCTYTDFLSDNVVTIEYTNGKVSHKSKTARANIETN